MQPFLEMPFSDLQRCCHLRLRLAYALRVLALPLLYSAVGPVASAQDYPGRPIRFVVEQAPSSVGDALARLIGQPSYDAVADSSSAAVVSKTDETVLVPSISPACSVKESIALTRGMPGESIYGAGSTGAHANIEIFSVATAVRLRHVPYRSSSWAWMDIAGGHLA